MKVPLTLSDSNVLFCTNVKEKFLFLKLVRFPFYRIRCLNTYLFPCSRLLLVKLTVGYLSKSYALCGTQKFIAMFTRPTTGLSASWSQSIHHILFIQYCFNIVSPMLVSRDSAVGIATGYGLDDWAVGVRVPVGSRMLTSPCCPDRLWGPPNLLYNGYRGFFPGGKAVGAWSWPLTSN
jgi:hypothetical protein